MMISQFFILSPRGDIIATRDYLANVPKGSAEIFLRKAREWGVPPPPDPDVDGADAVHAAAGAPPTRPPPLGDPARAAAPPAFAVDGVHYLHLAAGGLTFLATTRANVSPSLVLELLARVAGIIRDCCGCLSEEAVRRNGVLVYELLDEAIDGGVPVATSSEAVKDFVRADPVVVAPRRLPGGAGGAGATAAAAAALGGGAAAAAARAPAAVVKSVLDAARPDSAGSGAASLVGAVVAGAVATAAGGPGGGGAGAAPAAAPAAGKKRDEIFVDVVERLSATFSGGGTALVAGAIDGALQVRSFLSGSPSLALALSDELVIGGGGPGSGGGASGRAYSSSASPAAAAAGPVFLDDALFHEAVSLARFDTDRTLDLAAPPDGEFTAMAYRAPHPARPPFAVRAAVDPDPDAPGKALVTIRLRADFPSDRAAAGLEVRLPFPPGVVRVSAEVSAGLGGGGGGGAGRGALAAPLPASGASAAAGTVDWDEATRTLTWRVPRVPGGTELSLRGRASLGPGGGSGGSGGTPPFTAGLRAAVGPANLGFAIPQLCASGLAVRYLHVARGGLGGSIGGGLSGGGGGGGGGGGLSTARGGGLAAGLGGGSGAGTAASPYRWVRYVTLSSAYTVRLA